MSDAADIDYTALSQSKIYIAGHNGMVGSALIRRLKALKCENLLLRERDQLDLADQRQVMAFFTTEKPDFVFLAAAKVGGIHANNTYPADFIHDNLVIATNVIAAAHEASVKRLLFLGSSCIYPREAPQPMREECLLTGRLEPTNEPYAIAKIAGIKLCESFNRQYGTDFRSVMPTNLYGPHDNFDLETSHVLPALIRKFHEARESGAAAVEVWGTGRPRREFLFVDDLADACAFIMGLDKTSYDEAVEPMLSHINVGTGQDVSIGELAETVKTVTGFGGEIRFNTDYPDGALRKLLDVSKLKAMGWAASTELRDGIETTYEWFRDNA